MSEIAAAPTDIVAAPSRTISPAKSGSADGARMLFERIRRFGAQPAVAKSLPAIGLIVALGLAVMIWMAFSAPAGRSLFSGIADADKAAVVEALGSAGIAYELDQATGTLTVSEGNYHEARMLLASQGLPKSAPDGNEMISSLPLGASRAVEGERLRAAREVDLARSIEAIDVVDSARVHLAVEQPSVFLRDRSERAASVILTLQPGRVLGAEQVQAIVHLVASSVSGLAPEHVSVVDQSGKLLSSGTGSASSAAAERRVAMQAAVEERHREALAALLTPIVGAGNFTAEVHADLDFSETQATRESFPKDASTLRSEERSWTGSRQEDEAIGIPGTLANQAPIATTVAAAPGGKLDPDTPGVEDEAAAIAKTAENYARNYAIGREVSVSREAPGEVQRLSVAVALKQPEGGARTPQELAKIDALVKGAIGFNQARGDVVALSQSNFAAVPETARKWWDASWVALLARNLSALAIAAIVIFGIARPLMRKGALPLLGKAKAASAATTKEDVAAALVAERRASEDAVDITLKMIEAAPSYEARAVLIRDFVRQDPARAALVVRDLLRDDKVEGVEKNG